MKDFNHLREDDLDKWDEVGIPKVIYF